MSDEQIGELQALLNSPLFAGPDPTVLEDLKAEPEIKAAPVDPTAQLAQLAELDAEVSRIYHDILTRAPEHKVQPSTQRVRDCLDLMGNPQLSYRAVHITGTNGKTSTARMVEALLRERGLHTGRFTSPHLTSVRERIVINGQAISREDFIQAWEDVAPFVEMVDQKSAAAGGPRMSFFEVFTVMAYQAFAFAPVDVAVVEVGMGGKWDATNVIDAEVSVLLPVAKDHEKWLGAELTDIATEKLGILSPGATLVCAGQKPEVMELVYQRVQEQNAELVQFGKDIELLDREMAVGGQMIAVRTPAAVYEDVPVAMLGPYQGENAAVAIAAAEVFFGGGAMPGEAVEHALMATSSPGRMEVAKNSPLIIVDAAHNPAGAEATRIALEESFPGPRVAVFSAMADKDVEAVLSVLEPAFEHLVVTQMDSDRAMDLAELETAAAQVFGPDRVDAEPQIDVAIMHAAELAQGLGGETLAPPAVVIIGSILLAAQARLALGRPAPDGA
ncbi:MAG: folylpolyglutamate synthase/dihydrofolate synthase family protein [Trueperella sp.]|nr:folylpolyglutamate synthase/dihydrofolate synthase family protein [Trueperella sp.]